MFNDSTTDKTASSEEIKAVFKAEREARKEQKHTDFVDTQNEISEQVESGNEVILPNIDTASEGKKLAVDCFKQLTELGVHPTQVFKLVEIKGVKNENDLNKLAKSISFWQLNRSEEYMKDNTLTGIRLTLIFGTILIGSSYSTTQLRAIMRRVLNLEKGFNTRIFDRDTTSQQVLDFTRLFFDISINTKTGLRTIRGIKNYDEYLIEDEKFFLYPNALINSDLQNYHASKNVVEKCCFKQAKTQKICKDIHATRF